MFKLKKEASVFNDDEEKISGANLEDQINLIYQMYIWTSSLCGNVCLLSRQSVNVHMVEVVDDVARGITTMMIMI